MQRLTPIPRKLSSFFLVAFVSFFMLVALGFPASAFASQGNVGDAFHEGAFSYKITAEASGGSTGTVALTGFADPQDTTASLSIPASVTNAGSTYRVTSIGEAAFFGKTTLKSLDFGSAKNLKTIARTPSPPAASIMTPRIHLPSPRPLKPSAGGRTWELSKTTSP